MAERLLYQQWHTGNDSTRYPFAETADLISTDGREIVEGTFVDAILHPVGGQAAIYLSKVVLDHETVQLFIGDAENKIRASCSFPLLSPPSTLTLIDEFGRPAGIFISDSTRLSIFSSWGLGTHPFKQAASEFAATVCIPVPDVGLRGLELADGTLLTGEVWLVGDDGVVIRTEIVRLPATPGMPEEVIKAIRIDVVGDPLFRRRLCVDQQLFTTPRFVERIRVKDVHGTFECSPDSLGDIKITANNALAADTVLRVRTTAAGLIVEAVGTLSGPFA